MVNDNTVEFIANAQHWPRTSGNDLAAKCGIHKVMLLNDFSVAGL